jgi:hypothetical protein
MAHNRPQATDNDDEQVDAGQTYGTMLMEHNDASLEGLSGEESSESGGIILTPSSSSNSRS